MSDAPQLPHAADDHELFMRLFAEQHRRLHQFIASLTPNRTVAEEVFAETSVVLWRDFASFDRTRDFGAWSRGVALNQIHKARRSFRDPRLLFNDELVAHLAEDHERCEQISDQRRAALSGCLAKLRDTDRDLIHRCYDAQTTVERVAREIQRPAGSLYHALSRIRRALFECIERSIRTEGRA
ncbi:MAG: sigma-70 family RNA polymerase sigma factor [Planctomycetes bacterium]|nr:sigma-70 family RNA polymerase sigma factor [Planctomycetota bacterium]